MVSTRLPAEIVRDHLEKLHTMYGNPLPVRRVALWCFIEALAELDPEDEAPPKLIGLGKAVMVPRRQCIKFPVREDEAMAALVCLNTWLGQSDANSLQFLQAAQEAPRLKQAA